MGVHMAQQFIQGAVKVKIFFTQFAPTACRRIDA
jgi:hypothetical protein